MVETVGSSRTFNIQGGPGLERLKRVLVVAAVAIAWCCTSYVGTFIIEHGNYIKKIAEDGTATPPSFFHLHAALGTWLLGGLFGVLILIACAIVLGIVGAGLYNLGKWIWHGSGSGSSSSPGW